MKTRERSGFRRLSFYIFVDLSSFFFCLCVNETGRRAALMAGVYCQLASQASSVVKTLFLFFQKKSLRKKKREREKMKEASLGARPRARTCVHCGIVEFLRPSCCWDTSISTLCLRSFFSFSLSSFDRQSSVSLFDWLFHFSLILARFERYSSFPLKKKNVILPLFRPFFYYFFLLFLVWPFTVGRTAST